MDQTENYHRISNEAMLPWSETTETVIAHFQTSANQGLTSAEADQRYATYGANIIPEPAADPLWKRYWNQLTGDAVVRLLLIGAIVSLLLGDHLEGVAIFVMLNIMAGFGLWQEGKASDAARSLRTLDKPMKLVLRDGKRIEVPMDQIVPGDIVYLPNGSIAPVDGRVIAAVNAEKDSSKLTGESMSVSIDPDPIPAETVINDQHNMLYRGDTILSGNVTIVATKTGAETEIGKIAARLAETETMRTPLDEQLDNLGNTMTKIFIWVVALVIGFGLLRQFYNLTEGFSDLSVVTFSTLLDALTAAFINAVALIIAAIPEGLPAVLTITLAIAIKTMVERQALIRKPKAVEGAGSMNVLLSDKTGTLTANQMEVTNLYLNNQTSEIASVPSMIEQPATHEGLLRVRTIMHYCNNNANPTETAMLRWLENQPLESDEHRVPERVVEHEFDQTLKRMTTIHPAPDGQTAYVFTKGAPENLLPLCSHVYQDGEDVPLNTEGRRRIEEAITELASHGLRVIALADRSTPDAPHLSREQAERDMTFVGLVGLMDPPREDVVDAVAVLRQAGIRTVMVTGDNPLTAYHIARMVGIIDETLSFKEAVITGDELAQLEDPTPEFLQRLHSVHVFARVTPQHKAQIVHAMRQAGFIVGMTGDGVNDAIALKESDIGFAMGKGTDVAHEASDVVLLDSRFSTIPNAVEEGRNVIYRIRLYLSYILSGNGCEVGAFIVAYIIGLPIPLTALVLLVINFATDSFPALAMTFEPGEQDTMRQPPRKRHAPFITRTMWTHITVQTVTATIMIMSVYYYSLEVLGTSLDTARAAAFMTYIFQKLYRAFTARSLTQNIWQIGVFRNPYSIGAAFISLSIALFCLLTPVVNTAMDLRFPGFSLLLIAAVVGIIAPVAEEVTKVFLRRESMRMEN
jgi:Ca2+-transporting ATPase